jgi:hypothetical protein
VPGGILKRDGAVACTTVHVSNRATTLFTPVCTYVDRVRSAEVLQYQCIVYRASEHHSAASPHDCFSKCWIASKVGESRHQWKGCHGTVCTRMLPHRHALEQHSSTPFRRLFSVSWPRCNLGKRVSHRIVAPCCLPVLMWCMEHCIGLWSRLPIFAHWPKADRASTSRGRGWAVCLPQSHSRPEPNARRGNTAGKEKHGDRLQRYPTRGLLSRTSQRRSCEGASRNAKTTET